MKNYILETVLVFLLIFVAVSIWAKSIPEEFTPALSHHSELNYSSLGSIFTLLAPTAAKVKINLYNNDTDLRPIQTIFMKKGLQGMWTAMEKGDLKCKYYTFQILHKGKWLKETPGIWAKAVGVNGVRAAIIDLKSTDPEGWTKDVRPPLAHSTDIVIYEMHHRDFSVASNSGIQHKGKFLALTENGTKNAEGLSTGIDHLKELGITHVHLLPSYDFGSIDEARLSDNRYNWGYDPKNYNVPEGSFSTLPADPAARIREFKQMVQSLHRNGIRVILDVVYNHTFVTDESNFTLTAPDYFYRKNKDGSYSNASGCGNETASEQPMMRLFMIESVKYWAKEYHVDGFRFDLMGIHDIETMNQIRKELDKIDPTIYMYGEGWTAGASPLDESLRAVKKNGLQFPHIAVFSDDLRDAIKGSWNDAKAPGFVGGKTGLEESLKFGIVGATQHPQVNYSLVNYSKAPYAIHPDEVINYVSCHDDMCLNDKLRESSPFNTKADQIKRQNKLAQTIVFTSQGVPFILSGEELFRTKKGIHNSFQSPDSINEIDWHWKSIHHDLFDYYRNLILLRKQHPAFRMNTQADVANHLRFLDIKQKCVVGFMLTDHANGDECKDILVIHNGNSQPVEVSVPDGEWTAVVKDGQINLSGLGNIENNRITVALVSSLIAFRK
ncbi:MAG: type I pullulanase [Bacteroidota bacterium]|nr:type I pullulanase [Bacteroidota bacterium]